MKFIKDIDNSYYEIHLNKKMNKFLERFLITTSLLIYGALGWILVVNTYAQSEFTAQYSWMGACAVAIVLFVLYRNSLLLVGRYRQKKRTDLSKATTAILLTCSILLYLTPFILYSI